MLRRISITLCLCVCAAAQAQWREASSRHFVIYSEQDAASLQTFAERLERYDKAMRLLRGLEDPEIGPSNRLTVYVVPNLHAVQELSGLTDEVAGFYVPRARPIAIMARQGLGTRQREQTAQTVLLHEYAHHLLYNNYSAAFPAWFSEGYAEFHATARFESDGSIGIGAPPAFRAHGLVNVSLPLETLMSLGAQRLTGEHGEALYGRGWLLVHYLTLEPRRKGQLAAYLNALNSGRKGLEAATASFGELRKLERELERYMRRRRLSYLRIAPQALGTAPIAMRQLSPAEAAVMHVRIRSKRGVDDAAARALVPKARAAAAPYPDDVSAQTALAEAEFDAGNLAEAEAAADRALAVDPKSVDALICKGRARMMLAERVASQDPTVWREVRRWLGAANRADPTNPEPLMLFYMSFAAAGSRPTDNAVAGLLAAFSFAPQDRTLRMMVAHQHLVDGKAVEARAALGPIAFDPHAGELADAASAVIGAIDQGGAEAALAVWHEQGKRGDE